MSYIRVKNRQTNSNVYLQNRLNRFTTPPMTNGDLYVEKNETIGGNLDVSGNLTVHGDLKGKNFYATGNYFLDDYVLIPPGTVMQSAAITVPGGWLECNGSILSRIDYPDLFDSIGYTYGGSGTNFNLPDIRGRVPIGAGTGVSLSPHNLGATGGEERHTLTTAEMPSHNHTSNATGGSAGLATSDGANTANSGLDFTPGEPNLFATPAALTINNTGGGNSHNVMQPFITLRYIIKF